MQARQVLKQWGDEFFAKTPRRPFLELAEVEDVANYGDSREQIRSDKYVGTLNFRDYSLSLLLFFVAVNPQAVDVTRQTADVNPQAVDVTPQTLHV